MSICKSSQLCANVLCFSVRCETISDIFCEFCNYSGLRCQKLNGYAKSTDFVPGTRFEEDHIIGHSWNTVLVGGQWRLVDAMWGTLYAMYYALHMICVCVDNYYSNITACTL